MQINSPFNNSDDRWEKAFSHNFYLTEEWSRLWQTITGISLRTEKWDGNTYYHLRNVLPGVSVFDVSSRKVLRAQGIVHLNVLPERNEGSSSSPLGYGLWLHRPYAEANADYDRGFRRAVAQSEKNKLAAVFKTHEDPSVINDVYPLYVRHMARVNGVVLPRSFFEVYLNMKGASCLTVSFRDKVIGYGFGIEYGNNLYASWGGVDPSYYSLHPSHHINDNRDSALSHQRGAALARTIKGFD